MQAYLPHSNNKAFPFDNECPLNNDMDITRSSIAYYLLFAPHLLSEYYY